MAPEQPASSPHPSTAQLRPALELAWAVARARNQARSPLPIPGRMRRLVNAARLPDRMLSTIRQVLEEDSDFRAEVAEVADEELLGRLAQLWLVRPEGWEQDLAVLLDQYEDDRRRLDEEKQTRQTQERISTLEHALARAEAELQVLRKASTDSAAAIEAERRSTRRSDAARRELVESLDSVRAENERLVQQREELAAQVAELTRSAERSSSEQKEASIERDAMLEASVRLESETAQARWELSALRTEMESTRRSTAEALNKVAAAGRQLEDSLREAASSLGLAPESGSGGDAKAGTDPGSEERRQPLPARPKRTPVRLPPGVFADEPEAADYLMRAKGMTVAVDGYNVSISSWPGRDLPDQRWRLVHALAELVARFDVSVRLYFDGVESGGRLQPPAVARRRMSVEFSPSTVEADDKIIAFVEALDQARPVTVATNDGRVRAEVARRGANVISVEQLLSVLRRLPDPVD